MHLMVGIIGVTATLVFDKCESSSVSTILELALLGNWKPLTND